MLGAKNVRMIWRQWQQTFLGPGAQTGLLKWLLYLKVPTLQLQALRPLYGDSGALWAFRGLCGSKVALSTLRWALCAFRGSGWVLRWSVCLTWAMWAFGWLVQAITFSLQFLGTLGGLLGGFPKRSCVALRGAVCFSEGLYWFTWVLSFSRAAAAL